MKLLIKGIGLLGLLLLVASVNAQQNYYVDVTNDTGYTILFLNVSPADAQSWEEDVLGAEVLMDGDTFRVQLNGYNSPIFDIRATDEDGDSYSFYGVNVAQQDLTVTLADLDAD